MVQGVNQKNYLDSYHRNQKQTIKSSEEAPPFLLNFDEEGVVWEHGDSEKAKKDTAGTKNEAGEAVAKKTSATKNAEKRDTYESTIFPEKEKKKTEEAGAAGELFRQITRFLKNTVEKLKQFFWYGNEEGKSPVNTELPAEETKSDTLTREEKINEMIRKKDQAGLVEELTQHNTRVLAKNTELLTQYNRFGKVVEVDGSMKRQILEGDKAMKM